jgi:poly-gamma-glutamate synthesis protein (capsule biosynthesis protein)
MPDNGDLTLMAIGDLYIERPNPVSIFDGVREVLGQADLLLANQETPVTERGVPLPGKLESSGSRTLRARPAAVAAEAAVGISAVSLANNHMMDYGAEGLLDTMAHLKGQGIACAGGGANFAEAHQPAMLERHGVKVAMLCYTSVYPVAGAAAGKDSPGLATVKVHTAYQAPDNILYQPGTPAITITTPDHVQMQTMLEEVRQARKTADIVVVQFHWGVAQAYGRVCGYMKEMGRAAVDAGADLILGNHAHQLLGVEMYRDRLIGYSLNHFAFDVRPRYGAAWLQTVILKATIRHGRIARVSLIPVVIDQETHNPALARGEAAQTVRRRLEELSKEYGTSFDDVGSELVLGGPIPGTPPPLRMPEVLEDYPLFRSWPTSRGKGMAMFNER